MPTFISGLGCFPEESSWISEQVQIDNVPDKNQNVSLSPRLFKSGSKNDDKSKTRT